MAVIWDDEPGTSTSSAAPVAPPNPSQSSRRIYDTINDILSRARTGTEQMMDPSGKSLPGWAKELVNPVPGSVPQAAIQAATTALGLKPMTGGFIRQILKRAGLGGAAGGVAGGGHALVSDEPFTENVLYGAGSGALGGAIAGIGGARAGARGTRDTTMVQRAMNAMAREQNVSPLVRGQINTADPRSLYSADTLRSLQDAASHLIESEMGAVGTAARGLGAPPRMVLTDVIEPPVQPSVPGKINKLLGVTWVNQPHPTIPTAMVRHPYVSIEEAQQLIAGLRELKDYRGARIAELNMIRELSVVDPSLGRRYQQAITDYANNSKLIGMVRNLHENVALPGEGSPVDFPQLAEASRALGMGKTRGGSDVGSAAVNIGLGIGHPTSFYGATHLAEALRKLASRGQIDPTKVGVPPSFLRRALTSGAPYPETFLGAQAGHATAPRPRRAELEP